MYANYTSTSSITNGLSYGDIGSIITGIATISLVIVLIWQTSLTRKQIMLSHLPYLTPRFTIQSDNNVILLIVNVGNGNAVDLHLEIYNTDEILVGKVDRYALASSEFHNTALDLWKLKKVRIVGTYLDLTKKKYKIDEEYEYPPKKVDEHP